LADHGSLDFVALGEPVNGITLIGQELLQRVAQGGVVFDY
jgi:hypothetical protein